MVKPFLRFISPWGGGLFHARRSSVTPSPGAGDALLLETGDYLLLESGDKLLLE